MISYHELIKHSGNNHLIEACEIALLSILKGIPFHLHAEGVRGTGKTTILRSVKSILPEIERIKDCEYNCHPEMPHCPLHKDLNHEEIEKIGWEWIPVPFFEISHTAKPGTVAGSIDLEKLTRSKNPLPALLPGIIPRAHRGIIFVDEINRLADTSPELADILLDVMGTKPGKIQIEETGLDKVELTVNVSVWAASNPDEDPGSLEDIRKQLSDRFDFCIPVERPREEVVVEKILSTENYFSDISSAREKDNNLKENLKELTASSKTFELENEVEKNLARIYVKYKLESLRALKALRLGAILKSILKGKSKGELAELIEVTPLALKHRVTRQTLQDILDHLKDEKNKEPATINNYNNNYSTSNIGQKNEEQGSKRKNFLTKLLEKLRSTGPGNNECYKKEGVADGKGREKQQCQNTGMRGKSNFQMKPHENNVKAPEVNARPLSELIEKDQEIVKKGEQENEN